MTKSETAALLTLIAAFDRRTIGEADVEAWHLILSDLNAEDCAEAVRGHFTESREWLMPADVRSRALQAARRRAGVQRRAELDAQVAAENGGELTDRERPLLALMAGSALKPVPRPDWQVRHGKPPVKDRPPFTPEELKAAATLLDEAKPDGAA